MQQIACPNCDHVNRSGVRFCERCGFELAGSAVSQPATGAFCTNCGTRNQAGARFCFNCGHSMVTAAPSPVPSQGDAPTPATVEPKREPDRAGDPRPSAAFEPSPIRQQDPGSQPAVAHPGTPWIRIAIGMVLGFVMVNLALMLWPTLNAMSPALGRSTAEAAELAQYFVDTNYPDLSLAERTAYPAEIQGTGYYVVDFVDQRPESPPHSLRVLVDRYFRAVFAYEYIDGR